MGPVLCKSIENMGIIRFGGACYLLSSVFRSSCGLFLCLLGVHTLIPNVPIRVLPMVYFGVPDCVKLWICVYL